MRCDYVDYIDEFQGQIGGIYENRFRLLRFTPEQAREIIKKSAKFSGISFPDDLAERIIQDLRDPSTVDQRINPAELQIVCSRLVEGSSAVSLTDYTLRGGRVGLLEEFLRDIIERFPKGDREAAAHVLFELARRSAPISQRVSVSVLCQSAAQPERCKLVLSKLEALGLLNYHVGRSDSDEENTYELSAEKNQEKSERLLLQSTADTR